MISAVATAAAAPLEQVGHDLYRDVHKGLRNELFAITTVLGSADPGDQIALEGAAARQRSLFELLDAHAEHEDLVVGPVMRDVAPDLDEVVRREHTVLESAMRELRVLSDAVLSDGVVSAGSDRSVMARRWYLAAASFTSDYLAHQATEELMVSPVLADRLGSDGVVALEQEIVALIEPDHFAAYLRLILPATNPAERVGLVGGIREGAPAEVFAGAMAVATEVLDPLALQRLRHELG